MRKLWRQRAAFLALALCLILLAVSVPTRAESQILLCGEDHTDAACMERELSLWRARYAAGDRDLFLEMGAATAELLNYLGVSSATRASLMFYNTPEEIDAFLNSVEGIRRQMGYGA